MEPRLIRDSRAFRKEGWGGGCLVVWCGHQPEAIWPRLLFKKENAKTFRDYKNDP